MQHTSLAVLHDELERLREEAKAETLTELTKDLHFYPDLHGLYRLEAICPTRLLCFQVTALP